MRAVTIYSTPTCTYCNAAKDFFSANEVEYTEHNVAEDSDKRQEMIEKSGQMGVPVVIFGASDEGEEDELVIGFDEEKFKELLGIA